MSNNLGAYSLDDAIRVLYETGRIRNFGSESTLITQQKLKVANSKLASIELIMLDYYNGEFDTIGDLAGAISFVLNGDDDD